MRAGSVNLIYFACVCVSDLHNVSEMLDKVPLGGDNLPDDICSDVIVRGTGQARLAGCCRGRVLRHRPCELTTARRAVKSTDRFVLSQGGVQYVTRLFLCHVTPRSFQFLRGRQVLLLIH